MSESNTLNIELQQDSPDESPTKLKISSKQPKYWADEMAAIYQLDSQKTDKNEATIAEMYYRLRSRGFTL